uniref:Uncharacterized protein n=1 Tax=Romanomermis culicivorax TaxID=13658 RepID=A0A915K5F5_ROMCU
MLQTFVQKFENAVVSQYLSNLAETLQFLCKPFKKKISKKKFKEKEDKWVFFTNNRAIDPRHETIKKVLNFFNH